MNGLTDLFAGLGAVYAWLFKGFAEGMSWLVALPVIPVAWVIMKLVNHSRMRRGALPLHPCPPIALVESAFPPETHDQVGQYR